MTDTTTEPQAKPESNGEIDTTRAVQERVNDVLLRSNKTLARVRDGRKSVFEDIRRTTYKHRYEVQVVVGALVGGVPSDPKVAEGWIKTKLATDRDDLIREMVADTMVERGIEAEQAIEEATRNKHLNGFKRMPDTGVLAVEGRNVKAMIKEASNIRWPKGRWGETRKGTRGFFAEHIFVEEDAIPICVDGQEITEPTMVSTRFVHTWRGSGIQLEEVVENAEVTFHVLTDHDYTEAQWGELFVTAELNGLGAARSQGYGTFVTVAFSKVRHPRR